MQGKKLTREQMRLVERRKLNPRNWLVTKQPPGEMHLVHRHTSTARVLRTFEDGKSLH